MTPPDRVEQDAAWQALGPVLVPDQVPRSRALAPPPPAPDVPVVATPRAIRRHRPLAFRLAAPPYLLLGDVLALVAVEVVFPRHALFFVVSSLVVLLGNRLSGLYRSRLSFSLLDDLPFLAGACLASGMSALALTTGVSSQPDLGPQLAQSGLLLVVLLVVRRLAYSTVVAARRRGVVRHSALILGAGHVGIRLTETLLEHREFGLDPVGLVDSNPRNGRHSALPAPLLGGYDRLSQLIVELRVKVVIVAFGTMREDQLVDVLRTCDRLHSDIMFVPRLYELHTTTRQMDQAWGVPLVRVRRAAFRSPSWAVKRVGDAALASAALLLLSPVLLACALAVRLETGPGVLFRQERVGLDGRPFTLLKFRSLAPLQPGEDEVLWSISDDARLGPVGRFLRSTSLDEVPQLWNVLRGDMSLVGPRPERQHFVEEFSASIPRYTARHRVPAGLTGWSQIHGLRGDTSIEDRATFDNYYIENWSLWSDVKIMMRTVEQVVRRAGS